MSILYHTEKANVVAYALSSVSMPSLLHVEEAKKDLAQDVHSLARLGVQLDDSQKVGVMIRHNFNSSVIIDVKSQQHLDPILMEFKYSVLNKSIETLSQG